MREIDLGEARKDQLPINSFLLHGDTKSGKSTFAATAPRPLFLSDGSEHGFESLKADNWNDDATPLFETGVRPVVWTLDKESDLADAVDKARPLVAAGVFLSVWLDSISFFSDLIFNNILMSQKADKRDTRAAYGELGVRLRNVRLKVASLNISHGWLALTKGPEETDPLKKPMIPGAQADKFSAGCDFVWHLRCEQPQPSNPAVFNVYTRRFMNVVAGNRLGARADMLPSPFQGTYADYLAYLGYDVDAIRAGLPPIDKARVEAKRLAASAKPADAKPPVIAAQAVVAKPPMVVKTIGVNNGKPVAPTVKQ